MNAPPESWFSGEMPEHKAKAPTLEGVSRAMDNMLGNEHVHPAAGNSIWHDMMPEGTFSFDHLTKEQMAATRDRANVAPLIARIERGDVIGNLDVDGLVPEDLGGEDGWFDEYDRSLENIGDDERAYLQDERAFRFNDNALSIYKPGDEEEYQGIGWVGDTEAIDHNGMLYESYPDKHEALRDVRQKDAIKQMSVGAVLGDPWLGMELYTEDVKHEDEFMIAKAQQYNDDVELFRPIKTTTYIPDNDVYEYMNERSTLADLHGFDPDALIAMGPSTLYTQVRERAIEDIEALQAREAFNKSLPDEHVDKRAIFNITKSLDLLSLNAFDDNPYYTTPKLEQASKLEVKEA